MKCDRCKENRPRLKWEKGKWLCDKCKTHNFVSKKIKDIAGYNLPGYNQGLGEYIEDKSYFNKVMKKKKLDFVPEGTSKYKDKRG